MLKAPRTWQQWNSSEQPVQEEVSMDTDAGSTAVQPMSMDLQMPFPEDTRERQASGSACKCRSAGIFTLREWDTCVEDETRKGEHLMAMLVG